ncbi:MAG TPA: 1,2-phenylacetyl-CoA epoxidase subunit PaaD [Gemmatimonadaceae bacterium]
MVITREGLLELLRDVKDPELPMLDVVELGIVRDVEIDADRVRIDITPTYSGCPALQVIEREIETTVRSAGFDDVTVNTVLFPPWTTDWVTPEAKDKMREAGIAPPREVSSARGIEELVGIRRAAPNVECPWCGSSDTVQKSAFGSTACKAIHFCNSCRQPFDYFKAF